MGSPRGKQTYTFQAALYCWEWLIKSVRGARREHLGWGPVKAREDTRAQARKNSASLAPAMPCPPSWLQHLANSSSYVRRRTRACAQWHQGVFTALPHCDISGVEQAGKPFSGGICSLWTRRSSQKLQILPQAPAPGCQIMHPSARGRTPHEVSSAAHLGSEFGVLQSIQQVVRCKGGERHVAGQGRDVRGPRRLFASGLLPQDPCRQRSEPLPLLPSRVARGGVWAPLRYTAGAGS